MNDFIIFVKFLGWIVTIWVKLARLIIEKRVLWFWKGGSITKMTYITTKINNKFGPKWDPHLGPSLLLSIGVSHWWWW